ncbi:MAG TPA: transglutaminase, partial [Mangrovimonas sp.]|nr:transglutaminase [Mangrovimonas sp.]
MRAPILTTLFFLLVVQLNFAQDIKFGDVSVEELEEKAYPNDPSANAAVLYKMRDTYYNSNANSSELVTEIFERVKIYNKEGFDYATRSISLFKTRSSKERLRKLK